MTDYDKLYVKDGLVQLLSAFTKSEAEAVISTGAWQNKVSAGKDGTLINHHGSLVGWKALDNGGIGYDLTLSDLSAGNARNMYIDLGNDVVNIDETWNYTVEYVAKIMRTTEGGDNGHNTSYTNDKFGMWGSWSYRAGSWRLLCHGYGTETHWGHGVGWYTDANFSSTSQIKTVANRMLSTSNNGVMDGARYIYANGELVFHLKDVPANLAIVVNTQNSSPVTNDSTDIYVYGALMLASALAIVLLVVKSKKYA